MFGGSTLLVAAASLQALMVGLAKGHSECTGGARTRATTVGMQSNLDRLGRNPDPVLSRDTRHQRSRDLLGQPLYFENRTNEVAALGPGIHLNHFGRFASIRRSDPWPCLPPGPGA